MTINPFKWFKKKILLPHICEFKCEGYCTHYGMSTELERALSNLTDNHYPSPKIIEQWYRQGYRYAQVFQSHWKCSCGKNQTFFFLANPKPDLLGKRKDTISVAEYEEMVKHNPFSLGSSRGISMSELTNNLIEEFC